MPEIRIEVDAKELIEVADKLKRPIKFVQSAAAVERGTHMAQTEWQKDISGVDVEYSGGTFSIKPRTGTYMRAVASGLKYPFEGDLLSGSVMVDLPYAARLEEGYGAFDLKFGLLNGPAVKTSKNGTKYVDIGFRHAADDVPSSYKAALTRMENSGRQARIQKEDFTGWRTQIAGPKRLFGAGPGDYYTWRTGLFTGLTKNRTQEGSSTYMTFRRISENSDSSAFVHPGLEPRPVLKAVKEKIEPIFRMQVGEALLADLAGAL